MESYYVRSELHRGICTIEFYHEQANSLPTVLLKELTTAIHKAGYDMTTSVIVLRSAGEGSFCGGASFDELAAIKTEKEGIEFFNGFARLINEMRKCPKFIVGRIHGKAVGGGVGLAAACDYAIAVEGAEVRLSELTVGIGPFVVGPAVERKIGLSAFSQLAIDAALWRNADWARRKGLFAELHASVEGMDESISRITHSLSHSSAKATAELKQALWAGASHWDTLLAERAAISGKLVVSSAAKEAIAAKAEKLKLAFA